MESKSRILVGSPIRQSPPILKNFLDSLKTLNKSSIIVDYYFIDDNDDPESKELLKKFLKITGNSVFLEEADSKDVYLKNENTHFWDNSLIWKVAAFKNRIIEYCKDKGYDYLFLIDSDIVLAPPTLEHLISAEKHIVSEVFWTKWQPDIESMPQVWLYDQYSYSDSNSYLDSAIKYLEFREKLRVPGVYRVGGLGACTLIDREALMRGVSFDQIYNISFTGEDRHFSIRAAALGLELFVDTNYPAYHIYRDEELGGVEDYINSYNDANVSPSSLLDKDLFVIKFINKYFSYDFLNKPYLKEIYFLSPEYQKLMNEKRAELTKYLMENGVVCWVENCMVIDVIEKGDSCEMNTVFTLIYENNGLSEKKEIYCTITLKKDYETVWRVFKIKLMDSNKEIIPGFNTMDILDFENKVQ